MVSIRRRRLLGLCSGQNSFLAPLSRVLENGHTPENSVENTKPGSVHPLPLNDGYMPKEETISETMNGSPDLSASSPSKEHLLKQFPEVKRRKRHRRKHVENQEPCTMRGVYYKNRKWQAAIKVDKKQIHLGTVGSEEEAARLYDRRPEENWARFAKKISKTTNGQANPDRAPLQLQKTAHSPLDLFVSCVASMDLQAE
ncbi:UNVERIFIED_CONTAM: Ethylene-responsive transcription factor-like protein [Sesamum angustifolium]|uniref:Ethylene-responsive transcription factor-like protein n=1 Tax=Sesamum angustifolium TaxID=2727405 RepID=A0AAW2IWF0_9LAMI